MGKHPDNPLAPKGRKNMGHTATNVMVHFIFSTRNRIPSISAEIESDLYAYIGGIIREIAEWLSASTECPIMSFACSNAHHSSTAAVARVKN